MINIPKGTKDVLPKDSYKWHYVEKKARDICALFNAREIRTPVFEHTELFTGSIGEETDVVSKEMYTFLDKGNRSITLKPEGTAPVARSYVENSLESESLPLKMYYITPVFRYEAPQKGRLREHHQFGVEFYGSSSPYMDGEVISLAYKFLKDLGINDIALNLNSIGCDKCRPDYNKALKDYLRPHLKDMCPTCQKRFENNPLRILDCKVEKCKQIVSSSPKMVDCICDDCKDHKNSLEKYLVANNIKYQINPDIVRGLDYYTKTVFEFVTTALGSQGTVCGGGRYDKMVESVGGKSTPCVGFGIGLERLLMLLDAKNIEIPKTDNITVYVMSYSKDQELFCQQLVAALRAKNISADTDFMSKSLKAQFKYADKINAKYAVVIGEDELKTKIVNLKRMSDSYSQQIEIDKLADYIMEKY